MHATTEQSKRLQIVLCLQSAILCQRLPLLGLTMNNVDAVHKQMPTYNGADRPRTGCAAGGRHLSKRSGERVLFFRWPLFETLASGSGQPHAT